jgi:hypothetical protein
MQAQKVQEQAQAQVHARAQVRVETQVQEKVRALAWPPLQPTSVVLDLQPAPAPPAPQRSSN